MRILALVMSSKTQQYPELVKCQKETWDSIVHPKVNTIYYYSGEENSKFANEWVLKIPEGHGYFYEKTMLAFKEALKLPWWDYIFKTDNSAYVHKAELVRLIKGKQQSKYFGGHLYLTQKTTGDSFLWGEGFTLSRDLVKYLVKEFDENTEPRHGVEDVYIGAILKNKIQWDTSMMIHEYWRSKKLPLCHVYRCKNDNDPLNHFDDVIKAMRLIHKQLHHGKANNNK